MTPRPLLFERSDLPLHDAATTARIERSAAAGLPAHELMSRAGQALARLARAIAPHARHAWIAAGPGNNGGDGLVLATHLHAAGVRVQVSLLAPAEARVPPVDAAWALGRARAAGVTVTDSLPAADARFDLVVDGLFGVGQRRAVEGVHAQAIAAINAHAAPRLAIDVPTGLASDSGATLGKGQVHATHTLTLLTAKPGLFTGAGRELSGEIWFDDLGVTPHADEPPAAMLAGAATALQMHPPRHHLTHKGSYGDLHVAGGASGMVGAALLAAQAASLAGAGRVLVHAGSPDSAATLAVDVAHPELMLRPRGELLALLNESPGATVVAGCGGGEAIADLLPACLAAAGRLVLDADALNAIARDDGLRSALKARAARGQATILTPHPLEAARLLGTKAGDVQADRLAAARTLSHATGAVVVLKGSGTLAATPLGSLWINPTGNARLATAGTGDVLAGWIGGSWAAQARGELDPLELARRVAVAAVYVHGRAAEASPPGRLPLTAGHLPAAMVRALQALED